MGAQTKAQLLRIITSADIWGRQGDCIQSCTMNAQNFDSVDRRILTQTIQRSAKKYCSLHISQRLYRAIYRSLFLLKNYIYMSFTIANQDEIF